MWEDFKGRILCHFLPLFHTLIINPRLVIFKSVSSAKSSPFLTCSSLAALQILPVSHLLSPFIQSRGAATVALFCVRPALPPLLFHLLLLLLSPRTVRDGDCFLPFYLPLHICFMQTSRSSSRWSVCLLRAEKKKKTWAQVQELHSYPVIFF